MNNLERELQSGFIDNICQRCSGSGLKERKQREQQIQSLFVASSKRDDFSEFKNSEKWSFTQEKD